MLVVFLICFPVLSGCHIILRFKFPVKIADIGDADFLCNITDIEIVGAGSLHILGKAVAGHAELHIIHSFVAARQLDTLIIEEAKRIVNLYSV